MKKPIWLEVNIMEYETTEMTLEELLDTDFAA